MSERRTNIGPRLVGREFMSCAERRRTLSDSWPDKESAGAKDQGQQHPAQDGRSVSTGSRYTLSSAPGRETLHALVLLLAELLTDLQLHKLGGSQAPS